MAANPTSFGLRVWLLLLRRPRGDEGESRPCTCAGTADCGCAEGCGNGKLDVSLSDLAVLGSAARRALRLPRRESDSSDLLWPWALGEVGADGGLDAGGGAEMGEAGVLVVWGEEGATAVGADGGTGSTGAAASSDTLPLACDRSEESGSGWRECWRPFMAVLDSWATTVTFRRVRTVVSRSRLVFVRVSSRGGERPALLLFSRRCSCSRASAAMEPQRCSGDERQSDESTPMHAARHAHQQQHTRRAQCTTIG